MTDSSNHLKHHSQNSKKIIKKQTRTNFISNGINTHEEEKMEISNNLHLMTQEENRNKNARIESDSDEAEIEMNLEEVKQSKNVLTKNQDKIAEISHYLILKNVKK